MTGEDLIAGNFYDKYHSKNPLVRILMSGFYSALDVLLQELNPGTILDIGCGEGFLTDRYRRTVSPSGSLVVGADLSVDIVKSGRNEYDHLPFIAASVYDLPFPDNTFDLVIANELLEHVDEPETALKEIRRVAGENVLISVPLEPVWRLLNLCRLRYVSDMGNTPGHVQHWSKKGFLKLFSKYFDLLFVRTPFPWTMALGRKGQNTPS